MARYLVCYALKLVSYLSGVSPMVVLDFVQRRAWRSPLLWGAVILIVGAGLFWFVRSDEQDQKLTSALVQRGDLEALVTATGILQPRDFVDVGAQVSGQLKILHVEVGSQVQAGELLAEIDPTLYLARVDATRAQLRNQRAQLMDRRAQLTLAEIHHQRQQNLFKEDATTRESVQNAEASLLSAKAQIEALSAQIEQTESSLRAEEANLDYAHIYAPMEGTVVSIQARQGQTLNASQQAPVLMRIADLATMTVQAQVSEADIGKLQLGMPVYFTTLGSQGRRWHGELQRIEPTPEVINNVVLYNALFDVPNRGGHLMTQMTTQVFFVTAQATDALLVPVSALVYSGREEGSGGRPDSSGTSVGERTAQLQILLPDGRQESREVTVGVSNRVRAEVRSGVREGERVVTGMRAVGGARVGGQESMRIPRMMR